MKVRKRKALGEIIYEGEERDRSQVNEKENKILRLKELLKQKEKEQAKIQEDLTETNDLIDQHK